MSRDNLKVALVHDWLTNMGGAENVVSYMMDIYKDAPIYTSMCIKENLSEPFQNANIIPSFLQKKVKGTKVNHQKYFPYMPMAFESFNLNEYDVVLSSCSSCSKGIITNPSTMHICYCHTPTRYVWEFYYEYIENMDSVGAKGKLKKDMVKYFMNYMRMWDYVAANRVDYFIANSKYVASRIWKHYRRESTVIYPPADVNKFKPVDIDEEYYLCVSRLVPYKRIDLVVETFNELGLPLVIIGGGSELDKIKSMANDNIKVMGRQPDEVIREHYAKCRAFVFPGEEDFGITPVEAQASGRPVIAFGKGGALETVVDGKTGISFQEQTTKSLKEAVMKFQQTSFDKSVIRKHAENFSIENFKKKLKEFVDEKYNEFKDSKHWEVR